MDKVEDLKTAIETLKEMLSDGFFFSRTYDSKEIWNKIKEINVLFKQIRFDSKEERQTQWESFQDLVSKVKDNEQIKRENWNRKKLQSEEVLSRIKTHVFHAEPPNPLNEVIISAFTGGISNILSDIMGQFDEQKTDLVRCSGHLNDGWDLFKQSKSELLPRDKQEAYNILSEAQERLDSAWSSYKNERQQSYLRQQDIKRQHREERIHRIESNIANLENKKQRLLEILRHKQDHLSELKEKYYDAKSDGFRDRVSGWIEEEESNIHDIEQKIDNIDDWIQEQRDKL